MTRTGSTRLRRAVRFDWIDVHVRQGPQIKSGQTEGEGVRLLVDQLASAICAGGHALIAMRSVRLAQHSFHLAHTLSRSHVDALRSLAWCLLQRGDPGGALEYYRKLITLSPEFVDGRIECGFALSRLGRYSEALEQFHSALDYSPEMTEREQRWPQCS